MIELVEGIKHYIGDGNGQIIAYKYYFIIIFNDYKPFVNQL